VVRITVEVGNGATRYKVGVQAESIRRALEIVEGLSPGSDFRVTFPIDPETFFVKDPAAEAGPIEGEKPANLGFGLATLSSPAAAASGLSL
jgi:hypothetical protein